MTASNKPIDPGQETLSNNDGYGSLKIFRNIGGKIGDLIVGQIGGVRHHQGGIRT